MKYLKNIGPIPEVGAPWSAASYLPVHVLRIRPRELECGKFLESEVTSLNKENA